MVYDTVFMPNKGINENKSCGTKCGNLLMDMANMFKAFIGTNYLGVSFALSMSGLYLGIAGLILIATITVHCCYLIVKCKRYVIEDVVKKFDLHPESSVQHLKLVQNIEKSMSYGDVARLTLGPWGIRITNFALVVTQFGFCTNYFIFIGNTIQRMFPFVNGTIPAPSVLSPNATIDPVTMLTSSDLATAEYSNMSHIEDIAAYSTAPRYEFLVLVPFPLFVAFAYLRKIRHMGPSSVIADISVFVSYTAVMYYVLKDFKVADTVVAVNWAKFPIFFGQVTGSYEGIGTIIPIESSMEGNRKQYPLLLHLTIVFFTLLMASIGITGYLNYGSDIEQIITWNLPQQAPLTMVINITILIAILFTFPLQIFPIVEILEQGLFGPGQCLGPPVVDDDEQPTDEDGSHVQNGHAHLDDERKALLSPSDDDFMRETFKKCVVTVTIPDSVATWKRNVLRTLVVIIQAVVAIFLKDDFAYFSAFVGAIGSTILGFILPCIIHLVLRGRQLHPIIWIKNISVLSIGVLGGVSGVYVSIVSIVDNINV